MSATRAGGWVDKALKLLFPLFHRVHEPTSINTPIAYSTKGSRVRVAQSDVRLMLLATKGTTRRSAAIISLIQCRGYLRNWIEIRVTLGVISVVVSARPAAREGQLNWNRE